MKQNSSFSDIVIKNKISEISKAVERIESFGEENNIPPRIINNFTLSADEILTNIISYGYEDDAEHTISLQLSIGNNFMILVIEDDAKQFNPLEVPEADTSKTLEEREIGGLGIFIVKKLMDQVGYDYKSARNILTMKKKLI